jgi:hypothetical protein
LLGLLYYQETVENVVFFSLRGLVFHAVSSCYYYDKVLSASNHDNHPICFIIQYQLNLFTCHLNFGSGSLNLCVLSYLASLPLSLCRLVANHSTSRSWLKY